MKKIMFNDRFGLTEAVLAGRKTMTRRIIPEMVERVYEERPHIIWCEEYESFLVFKGWDETDPLFIRPRYKPGEVVAVAQCLRDMGYNPRDTKYRSGEIWGLDHSAAWTNKMFVSASECIHQIRITGLRVERLQDISAADCLREGIREEAPNKLRYGYHAPTYLIDGECFKDAHFLFAKGAFAELIDKISGKGNWNSNPWVFVYEFELVK